jgi:hypothetical protein
VTIADSALSWNAGAQTSNYEALRTTALSSGADSFLVEAANHTALAENVSIAQGAAFIDGIVTTFFERAAAYGDGAFDSAQCIAAATPLLASSDPVAAVCPQAALGVVDPASTCVESTGAGQVNPQGLRCGAGADDLAVALSGLTPSTTWLTRQSMRIPAGTAGIDAFLGFAYGVAQSPVIVASRINATGCGDAGTSVSSGSGSGASSSGGMVSSGSGPGEAIGDGLSVGGDVIDALASDDDDTTNCSCSGTEPSGSDGTTASSDACSGSSDPSSGGCSGSSSTDDSSSSDSCSSGSSGGSDSCSGDSGGDDGCSGSSGSSSVSNCSTAGPRRVRLPKLSILLMAALALAAPLRRRGRRGRAGRRGSAARA